MSKASYDNVKERWLRELDKYSKGTPIVLVGTKLDLRSDVKAVETVKKNKDDIVTTEQGESLAKEIKAIAYLETSARQNKGVNEIFEKCLEVRYGGGGGSGGAGCCILQ